jgi:nucleotide-binding universal stress UspA family protein
MPEIKKILFPVDFSQQCHSAASFVNSFVEHFAAELTLIHAIGMLPEYYVTYGIDGSDTLRKELRESSTTSMQAFLEQTFRTTPVRTAIDEGNPAEIIVKYAQTERMDLIMMPTHGFGPLRRFLIGSVTAKVLHDTQCPVWTSVHTDTPSSASATRTILCAVDSGESSVSLMRWANWLAGSYGAALKLVHVIPAVNETSMNPGEIEVRRYLTCKARDEFANWRTGAGVKAEVQLRGGEIAAKVADTALQEHADLLVIGRGHIQRRLGGLRTESLAIIREAPCPVISV